MPRLAALNLMAVGRASLRALFAEANNSDEPELVAHFAHVVQVS
jgi:hypothetical protein